MVMIGMILRDDTGRLIVKDKRVSSGKELLSEQTLL